MSARAARVSRRHWLLATLAAALAAAGHGRVRAAASFGGAGEGAFDSIDLDWQDAARQRPVPVRLHLPRGPHETGEGAAGHETAALARRPLVVFSHGIGGSRRGYTWLGHHLARHGIASLHLQHVGSDRALWSGSPWSLVSRLQDAADADEARARAEDWRFAVDTLLASAIGPRLDAGRIAAAGHSYGANTSLLVAGARVAVDGRPVSLADPRVRAAVVISAPPFYGAPDPAAILGGVTVPTLHVTCTDDVIRIPGFWSGVDDRIAVFEATGSARKWLAVYEGGSHSMFTDRGGTGGPLNPLAKAATRELVLGFLRRELDGDPTGFDDWRERHAGILAGFRGG